MDAKLDSQTQYPPPTPIQRRALRERIGDGALQRFALAHEMFDRAAAGDAGALAELERGLKAYRRVTPFAGSAKRRDSEPIEGGNASEWRIADAISRRVAALAETDPGTNMHALRQHVLGRTTPLKPAEALAFLESQSAAAGAKAGLVFVRENTGPSEMFRADPESPLSALSMWSNFLTRWYPWSQPRAAWFLLTGEPPPIPALQALITSAEGRRPYRLMIAVTAMPHVSPGSVAAAFKEAKREAFGTRRGRLAQVRHQAMADFIDQETLARVKQPPWPEAFKLWNKQAPPEWRYKTWVEMARAYSHENATPAAAESRSAAARRAKEKSG
jgi:hypothetical protein